MAKPKKSGQSEKPFLEDMYAHPLTSGGVKIHQRAPKDPYTSVPLAGAKIAKLGALPAQGHLDAGGVVSKRSPAISAFVGRMVAEGRTKGKR